MEVVNLTLETGRDALEVELGRGSSLSSWGLPQCPHRLPRCLRGQSQNRPQPGWKASGCLMCCWQSHSACVTKAYSTLALEAGCGLNWALHPPRGLLPRGVSRSGGYDRFYSFHRSSKNKQGTAGVGCSERWRRSISVRETSEYSLGLLLLLLGGCLAAEKVISHHLLTPAFSSHALPQL